MTKESLIETLNELGCKDYKLRFIKRGKYGEPEAWIYPKDNPKQEMVRQRKSGLVRLCDFNGNPKMESCSGMLIEQESLDDLDFLKKYLYSYIK